MLEQEECQLCWHLQHSKIQSLFPDDLPHGHTSFLIRDFFTSVDLEALSLSDIGDSVYASELSGLSGITLGEVTSELETGLLGLPVLGLRTLFPRTKGLRLRGLCRRGWLMWPRGEPDREVERLSAFGVFLTPFSFCETWVATMMRDVDLWVCAWCLPERHHFRRCPA